MEPRTRASPGDGKPPLRRVSRDLCRPGLPGSPRKSAKARAKSRPRPPVRRRLWLPAPISAATHGYRMERRSRAHREMVAAVRALGMILAIPTPRPIRPSRTPWRTAPSGSAKRSTRSASARVTILHCREVDVLPNGKLDFTDRIRALDIVLASCMRRGPFSRPAPPALSGRDASSARHGDHASHQSSTAAPPRIRPRLSPSVRGSRRKRYGRRNRRRADASRPERRARAPGDRRRRDDQHRQRLSPRRDARAADGRHPDGAPRLVEPQNVLNTRPIGEVRAWIAAKRGA